MADEKKIPGTQETKENELIDKIKAIVKEGSVTRIVIKKDDKIILNLPMTLGVVGTVVGAATAPWALILATIATIGLDCSVEVEKENGEITVIHGHEK